MDKYEYDIVIENLLQSKVGSGVMKPDMLVIHHSAQVIEGDYDVIKRLNSLAQAHIRKINNGGFAYHFYIPRDESNKIYVTRYLNQIQFHCSNASFNKRSLGILVEGDFEKQKPTQTQLNKLKQLLDGFPNLFGNPDIKNINPKDNETIRKGEDVVVKGTVFTHCEVAEKRFGSICAGRFLNPLIREYREKKGNVIWDTNKIDFDNFEASNFPVEDSNKNFIAGNLYSQIEILEEEKVNLESQYEYSKTFIKSLENRIAELDQMLIRLRLENNKLLQTVASGLSRRTPEKEIENKKNSFADFWNKMPMIIRYSLPNIIAAIIPSLIIFLEGLTLDGFNDLVRLGFAGFTFALIKSIIIGVLKKWV
jgi:hypothetical protein